MRPARTPERELFDKRKARLRHMIVMAKHLTPSTRVAGYVIADLVNFEHGYAWPSQETLAEQLGFTVRTVQRAVKPLHEFFDVERHGRSHRYFPKWSAIPDILSGISSPTPDKNDIDTRQKRHGTPDKNAPLSLLSNPTTTLAGANASVGGQSAVSKPIDLHDGSRVVVAAYSAEWHELIAWHEQRGEHSLAKSLRSRAGTGSGKTTAPAGWRPSAVRSAAE